MSAGGVVTDYILFFVLLPFAATYEYIYRILFSSLGEANKFFLILLAPAGLAYCALCLMIKFFSEPYATLIVKSRISDGRLRVSYGYRRDNIENSSLAHFEDERLSKFLGVFIGRSYRVDDRSVTTEGAEGYKSVTGGPDNDDFVGAEVASRDYTYEDAAEGDDVSHVTLNSSVTGGKRPAVTDFARWCDGSLQLCTGAGHSLPILVPVNSFGAVDYFPVFGERAPTLFLFPRRVTTLRTTGKKSDNASLITRIKTRFKPREVSYLGRKIRVVPSSPFLQLSRVHELSEVQDAIPRVVPPPLYRKARVPLPLAVQQQMQQAKKINNSLLNKPDIPEGMDSEKNEERAPILFLENGTVVLFFPLCHHGISATLTLAL
jgi:hypothetical protein